MRNDAPKSSHSRLPQAIKMTQSRLHRRLILAARELLHAYDVALLHVRDLTGTQIGGQKVPSFCLMSAPLRLTRVTTLCEMHGLKR